MRTNTQSHPRRQQTNHKEERIIKKMKKRTIEHSNKEAGVGLSGCATQQTSTVNRGGREEEGRKEERKEQKKHQEERKNKSRKSTTTKTQSKRKVSW